MHKTNSSMDNQQEMMTEDELQELPPALAPAVADPDTAALTAGQPPEPEDAATPEEEQEDPYAGRDLPGEEPEDEKDSPRAEDELPPPRPRRKEAAAEAAAEAVPAAPAAPAPPAAPAVSSPMAEPDAARRRYWQGVLTGSAQTVPDAVRQRAGVNDAALSDEQREYRLCSGINRSWAVDHMGLSREQVRADWARLRAELAERYHVADDERELFTALSVEAQDAPRREAAIKLYEEHYRAGLMGQIIPFPGDEFEQSGMHYAFDLAFEASRRGEVQRERHLPLAQELAEGLQAFAALEEDAFSAPRFFASVPELASAVESLTELSEQERLVVYTLAQAELRARDPQRVPGKESLLRTLMRSARRGSTQLGYGVGQALTHASVATMSSLGSSLGETVGTPLKEAASALDLRARIMDEARSLLHDEVKPLDVREQAGLAAQLAVDATGATPSALVAFCGGAGFAALSTSGVGHSVAEARRRAPEGSQQLQYFAGVLAGALQASIYAGMTRVGGRLLENAISSFARASGKGARAYVLPSLGVAGAMGAEGGKLFAAGKAADVAGLGAQELAARAERVASNIDWRAYGDNARDVELNLREAAMTLPFVLIASGRVALRHFRSRRSVLGDGHALLDWGIDEGTRDAIMKERDINRQGDMLREALSGSHRWSGFYFFKHALQALRMLNTDYYQVFRNGKDVADFLQQPSEGSRVKRPPLRQLSADNPEHVQQLIETHGTGEKSNRARLAQALQLWDEWWQKAHIVDSSYQSWGELSDNAMPTALRRRHYGMELLRTDSALEPRIRSLSIYAPMADFERTLLLRDRVAELHDLSYQMLLSSYSLDSLSHSTRDFNHLRKDTEGARLQMLGYVGRAVLRCVTGTPEPDALAELGKAISGYFARRRYRHFPPAWMNRVENALMQNLDEYALATAIKDLPEAEPELLQAFRVVLGMQFCARTLTELLPLTVDFRTALSRGMSPAQAYVHLLSRELGVDMNKVKGVGEMLEKAGGSSLNLADYSRRNRRMYNISRQLFGREVWRTRGEGGRLYWSLPFDGLPVPNWHSRRYEAVNAHVAGKTHMFLPFGEDSAKAFRQLEEGKDVDVSSHALAKAWQFTPYDQLCRQALKDGIRRWGESAPYALPGLSLRESHYLAVGGAHSDSTPRMFIGKGSESDRVKVNNTSLTTPLSLYKARFFTYWWRQLNAGLVSSRKAGEELVRLRVITPEEWQRVQDIAKPLLMPRNPNVPLKLTPPPDIPGMNEALARHLTDFSLRYMLVNFHGVPMEKSEREWFNLIPYCPLEPGRLPKKALRLTRQQNDDLLTCWANRMAVRELQEFAPKVQALRLAHEAGELEGSVLTQGVRNVLGMNEALKAEQAWCMHESGEKAFMSTSPAYWLLMEQPLKGWQHLAPEEQEALRRYLTVSCRLEPASESLEAEARGEKPDYVLDALRNLQELLEDYPRLHEMGVRVVNGNIRYHHLELEGREKVDYRAHYPHMSPQPSETVLPLYEGGRMRPASKVSDFSLIKGTGVMPSDKVPSLFFFNNMGRRTPGRMPEQLSLPDGLSLDARVGPALSLLRALRRYPGSRPYNRPEGIEWQGKLYGGINGEIPEALRGRGDWYASEPLTGLIHMLRKVDDIKRSLPEGELPRFLGVELDGLEEVMDFSPLANVTCYRDAKNPAHVCRLMPGELNSAIEEARLPYVTHSLQGVYINRNTMLTEEGQMHKAYMPLDRLMHFRPLKARVLLTETRNAWSRRALDYTLSSALDGSHAWELPGKTEGGVVSLRELLLRLAEDSGFSESILLLEPSELTYGQLQTLKLARALLMDLCAPYSGEKSERRRELYASMGRDAELREVMQRTLWTAAEDAYEHGESLFMREYSVQKKKKKRWSLRAESITQEDRQKLEAWIREDNRRRLRDTQRTHRGKLMEGFNDHVREDGYSRGFFDE